MPERSYGDMAKQMLDLAAGGPIEVINRGARATTGDLLFPIERTTRYRNYLQQQQRYLQPRSRLPGTDITPLPATFAERFVGQ